MSVVRLRKNGSMETQEVSPGTAPHQHGKGQPEPCSRKSARNSSAISGDRVGKAVGVTVGDGSGEGDGVEVAVAVAVAVSIGATVEVVVSDGRGVAVSVPTSTPAIAVTDDGSVVGSSARPLLQPIQMSSSVLRTRTFDITLFANFAFPFTGRPRS